MIDMHVHLERGAYTEEWLMEFVRYAQERGITKLHLLEHSHRFEEFQNIYESISKDVDDGECQKEWLERKTKIKLWEYKNFINEMRKMDFPIEINFGLEICYFPDKEKEIEECVSNFHWDFLTGSIHWVDGWGFDNPENKESWHKKDIDHIYMRYYGLMIQLVKSGIFDVLAHPDSIKCFNYYSSIALDDVYKKLALALKDHKVQVEFNNGLFINYNHEELGTNRKLLKILLENGVEIVTASDAHTPEDVGRFILEANDIINKFRGFSKESREYAEI